MKIINRRLFKIKYGKMEEAAALMKAEVEAFDVYKGPSRIYMPLFAPGEILAVEWEYESLAEYESLWTIYGARPASEVFLAKFGMLETGPHFNELRQLVAANEVDGSKNTIAVRWVDNVKPGNWQGGQDVLAANVAEFVTPGGFAARLSMPEAGQFGEQTLEIEFVSLAGFEAALAEWSARPTAAAYREKVKVGLREGGTTEVWRIYH
ncbi:MAG: hypothetical protein MUQ10_18125 [Anaerolineae bacterium]|nr:hypothetical protein [Anaerolineae bacterium]